MGVGGRVRELLVGSQLADGLDPPPKGGARAEKPWMNQGWTYHPSITSVTSALKGKKIEWVRPKTLVITTFGLWGRGGVLFERGQIERFPTTFLSPETSTKHIAQNRILLPPGDSKIIEATPNRATSK